MKLHDYQIRAIDHMAKTQNAALFAQMGTGKTITTLTYLAQYKLKALVIAPKRVVETVWKQEAERWPHTQHLMVSRILGTPKQRLAALAAEADLYLINVENVPWLFKQDWDKDFDALVLDELSLWKSTGKRWKELFKHRDKFRQVIGLTGTPAPNGLLDLWPQMQMIEPGCITRTKTLYKQLYFYSADPFGYKWNLRPGADKQIYDKIEPIVMRVSNDQLKLPELVTQRIPVPLSPSVQRLYKTMKDEGVIDELPSGPIVAESAAAVGNKLMQISNGAIYNEANTVIPIHDAKLDALGQIISEQQGAPLLVAYTYRHDQARIAKRWPHAVTLSGENSTSDNEQIVDNWNAGKIPLMLLHPASGGHGLNLQHGGNHLVWFGPTWNLEHYDQLIARLHRQGQRSTVFNHILCGAEIDYRVADALEAKADVQQALLDYLQ